MGRLPMGNLPMVDRNRVPRAARGVEEHEPTDRGLAQVAKPAQMRQIDKTDLVFEMNLNLGL